MRTRVPAAAAVVTGAALLLASGLAVVRPAPASSVGTAAAEALATVAPPARPVVAGPPRAPGVPVPLLSAGPAQPGTRSARLEDLRIAPPAAPLTLRAAGTEAPVVPVGLRPDGQVEVPDDVRVVGWYRFGASPADPAGSTVLVGHVDDAEQGLGVLAGVRDLPRGATLEVELPDGPRRYRVVARESWQKDEVPMDRLFSREGAPRLVLVTCSGPFDERTGTYRDNTAVTAVPV